jgi:hypothetical protein
MTNTQLASKFTYHMDLAAEAEQNSNYHDVIIEDTRAELALSQLMRNTEAERAALMETES